LAITSTRDSQESRAFSRVGGPEAGFHFSIRCRRNSSVPHPSLARICTGVWLESSEYHTHTLPLDCSGPEVASAVTSTAGNDPAGTLICSRLSTLAWTIVVFPSLIGNS